MVVIGYELVSYLLHYTSTHCVTFKELFVCKNNNKNGIHEICTLIFFSIVLIHRDTITQNRF